MTANTAYKLKTQLGLKWLHGNTYEATVSVTTTDTCFHEGELTRGAPSGVPILTDTEYLTFSFTHTGEICGEIVRTVQKTIEVTSSVKKIRVTAFSTVNGSVSGEDTKDFPREGSRGAA